MALSFLVQVTVQFVVDQVPMELAVRSLDETVERHRHHQHDLSHRGYLHAFVSRRGEARLDP